MFFLMMTLQRFCFSVFFNFFVLTENKFKGKYFLFKKTFYYLSLLAIPEGRRKGREGKEGKEGGWEGGRRKGREGRTLRDKTFPRIIAFFLSFEWTFPMQPV